LKDTCGIDGEMKVSFIDSTKRPVAFNYPSLSFVIIPYDGKEARLFKREAMFTMRNQ
jgi:hypothetical protein